MLHHHFVLNNAAIAPSNHFLVRKSAFELQQLLTCQNPRYDVKSKTVVCDQQQSVSPTNNDSGCHFNASAGKVVCDIAAQKPECLFDRGAGKVVCHDTEELHKETCSFNKVLGKV